MKHYTRNVPVLGLRPGVRGRRPRAGLSRTGRRRTGRRTRRSPPRRGWEPSASRRSGPSRSVPLPAAARCRPPRTGRPARRGTSSPPCSPCTTGWCTSRSSFPLPSSSPAFLPELRLLGRQRAALAPLAGGPDRIPVVLDDVLHRVLGVVREVEQVHVLRSDRPLFHHRELDPAEEPLPVLPAHQHDREPPDLPRLDEGQRLEELIHRPEPSRHDDVPGGVLHEHHLAGEEVPEGERLVLVPVRLLLRGELDVQPDRQPLPHAPPAVRRLHDPGSPAGDDGEPAPGKQLRHLHGGLVGPFLLAGPGAAEDGDGRADVLQLLEPVHELAHDPEHAPRFAAGEFVHRPSVWFAGLPRGPDPAARPFYLPAGAGKKRACPRCDSSVFFTGGRATTIRVTARRTAWSSRSKSSNSRFWNFPRSIAMITARCQAVSGTMIRSPRGAIERASRAQAGVRGMWWVRGGGAGGGGRGAQAGLQTPHPRQIPGLKDALFSLPSPSIRMADTGHFFAHRPHPLHRAGSNAASNGEV